MKKKKPKRRNPYARLVRMKRPYVQRNKKKDYKPDVERGDPDNGR